jgi:hypothetical protein
MAKTRGSIRLWDLGSGLELGLVRDFMEEAFGPVYSCPRPQRLVPDTSTPDLARKLLAHRIPDPGRLGTAGGRFSPKELDELTLILDGNAEPSPRRGTLLEGLGLASSLGAVLGPTNFKDGNIQIIFTSALPGMWDTSDCRYHPRAVVCGFPSVVSTSGAVEGPEKPRGYYGAKMMGLTEDEARRKYIGRFLEHGDTRLTEVAKGLAAQAVFYNLTGEPFCEKERCRLFNARWQEQLVEAQVNSGRFCDHHGWFLKDLRRQKAGK